MKLQRGLHGRSSARCSALRAASSGRHARVTQLAGGGTARLVATRVAQPITESITTNQNSSSTSSSASQGGPAQAAQEQAQEQGPLNWFDVWYPVAYEADIDKTAPYRFVLMEIPLVIWWDPNASAWRVFEDLCPHRLVPLSEGRINKRGNLECGYHAWEFGSSGQCERIPTGGNERSARACVASFPSAVRQGLLWVKPVRLPNPVEAGADAALAAAAREALDAAARIPVVPELDQEGWMSQDTWRDLPMDYSTLLENVLDSSHVPFTHHKSMSNRNQIGDFKIELTSPVQKSGFSGFWPTGPRGGALGSQSSTFSAPGYVKHYLDARKTRGFEALTVVYGVPTGPGRCRLINRNGTRFAKAGLPSLLMKALPAWVPHVSSHVLLEDDQIFLHLGEVEYAKRRAQGASVSGAYFLASQADTLVGAYRAWLDRHAGGGPFGKHSEALLRAFGPREGREQLLDRFSQHTAHCQTCQKALKRVQAAGQALRAAAVVAGALAVLTLAVAVAGGGSGAAALTYEAVRAQVGGNAVLAGASWAVLSLGSWLAGAGAATPGAQVLRALGWALAALVAWSASQTAGKLEGTFFKGTYPPPRNLATDGP